MDHDVLHADLRGRLNSLLEGLSANWPDHDLAYIREEVGHGEYGDAWENLVALGLRNGAGFDRDQVRKIQAIGEAMDLRDSPLLLALRNAYGDVENTPNQAGVCR